MKLTNGEIFSAAPALGTLFDQAMPVKISMALADMMDLFSSPFEKVEKVKNGLIKKYGTSAKDGSMSVNPSDASWPKFIAEHDELMAKTNKLELIKVEIPQESDGKQLTLTPRASRALSKLITIAEPKDKTKDALSEGPITEGK